MGNGIIPESNAPAAAPVSTPAPAAAPVPAYRAALDAVAPAAAPVSSPAAAPAPASAPAPQQPPQAQDPSEVARALQQQSNDRLQIENELLRRGLFQPQPQPQQVIDPLANLRVDPADMVEGEHFNKTLDGLSRNFDDKLSRELIDVGEMVARVHHPDYDEVVDKYLTLSPSQAKALAAAGKDSAEMAYRMAKTNPAYIADVQAKTRQSAVQDIQTNSERAPSLASVPGVTQVIDGNQNDIDRMRGIPIGRKWQEYINKVTGGR